MILDLNFQYIGIQSLFEFTLQQDINDNTPVFSKPIYTLTIPENHGVGKEVLQVTAQDSDDGKNRVLEYTIISGNSLGRFFIDSISGKLYIKSVLDRDPPRSEESFTLTVRAKSSLNQFACSV